MKAEGFTRTRGEKLGAYILIEPIGRGGFSEVWRATTGHGPDVALKVLVHPEHAAQLRSEAKALSLVRGPGIVPVLSVEIEQDPPFLVLQLLHGGDLRKRLAGGALGPVEAVGLFEKIVSIVERVHREGVVHGDLKPENVLFDQDGRLSIGDFGLSRRIAQRSASLSVSASLEDARIAGTLDYMAPEQRAGERPTPRSDVFALGVILYELITGERPQGVFKMPSERDPTLPPVIDRALASSLAPDPEHRFASAGALLAFVRSGLGSDWQQLAVAHERVQAVLAKDPWMRFVRGTVGGLLLGSFSVVLAATDERGKAMGPMSTGFVGLTGVLVGAVAALFLHRALRAEIDRRRQALERLRDKIEGQIRAETKWTVVREARRAAAVAPAGLSDLVGVGVGALVVFVVLAGALSVGFAALVAAGVAVALWGFLKWNRETRVRRHLSRHLPSRHTEL